MFYEEDFGIISGFRNQKLKSISLKNITLKSIFLIAKAKIFVNFGSKTRKMIFQKILKMRLSIQFYTV